MAEESAQGFESSETPPARRPPNAEAAFRRGLGGLVVAVLPLVTVAVLDAAVGLSAGLVGAGVLLSIVLIAIGALTLLPRKSGDGSPSPGVYDEEVPRDVLTGLPTFHPFSQRLLEEWNRIRHADRASAVVIVDVNHLEQINRDFGSEAGDAALRKVADTLEATKRVSDVLARMGDDEFGLILFDCDEEGARLFVDRVHESLARESIQIEVKGRTTSLWTGICAGIGICDPLCESPDEALTAAVDDLNQARAERDRRRNRWGKSA